MKNHMYRALAAKKNYIHPIVTEHMFLPAGLLCASGSGNRVQSSIVNGGDNSGNVANAF